MPDRGVAANLSSVQFIPAKLEEDPKDAPTSPNRQPGGRSGDRAAACGLDSAPHSINDVAKGSYRTFAAGCTSDGFADEADVIF